ncbi:MAG: LPS translocon maturation chaperone LptM [bacterium]
MNRNIRIILLLVAIVIVTGCGRKGELYEPDNSPKPQKQAQE